MIIFKCIESVFNYEKYIVIELLNQIKIISINCFAKTRITKTAMKIFFSPILLLLCSISIFAQDYSRVKIYANPIGLKALSDLGVTVDHGTYKQNTFFISDFSAAELQIVKDNNYQYEILIDDVEQFYLDRIDDETSTTKNVSCPGGSGSGAFDPQTPLNFNQGTMGGYLKYSEMLAELDAMATLYPSLITTKAPISTYLSHENRPIYFVRISDNPGTDEATEPKVLYSAIHHAREPMSLMETIFYMWYLLENYNTSDEIKYLVDNMQMYFVPCVNPDGYIYNETTNPGGGGMWRKNRKLNSGGTYGVDLNRNYSYGWGTTGTTTTNQSSDTYCGTGPFSEPETQAMRWLVQNNTFVTCFNAHTYAKDILFPIGTTDAEFADHHDYFQDETNHMVQFNGYTAMKSSALYEASGDSDDYMYKVDIGVGVKDTMFVHTPEVGTDFWQPASEIEATCQEMVFPNLILAHLTKKYLVVTDTDPVTVATMSGNFNHSAQRLGLEDGAVTVSIEPLLNVLSVGSPVVYDIALRATGNGVISYNLDPGIQFGDEIKYILITDNGLWLRKDTIVKSYGVITLQSLEDATSTTNWTGTWSTTTSTFVSASQSFTDSPSGNYSNNANRTYAYVPSIDLTNVTSAMISYYAKWEIETDYDFVQFQVSIDNGATWIGQCGNYTVPGTSANGSVQPNNLPIYEGFQTNWVVEEINLSDYIGQTIKVRFQLRADGGQTEDGFYFDDFKIMYNEAGPAVTPVASFTPSSTTICTGESVSYTDFSQNQPTSWAWTFGDGGTSISQNPTYTYNTPGVYSVQLIVSNSAGSDTLEQMNSITVNETPFVELSSADANGIVCLSGGNVTLYMSPASATITGTGVTGNIFDPISAGIGIHTLTAEYLDPNGCEGTYQYTLTVDECLSIGEIAVSEIKLFPNPNNGHFSVTGLEVNAEFSVFSLDGKIISNGIILNKTLDLDLKNAGAGLYYFESSKQGFNKRIKIIIQ